MTKKRHKWILYWDDERSIDNGIIVTLVPGRAFYPHAEERLAEHVRGFDTLRQAMYNVARAQPCYCERCQLELIVKDEEEK